MAFDVNTAFKNLKAHLVERGLDPEVKVSLVSSQERDDGYHLVVSYETDRAREQHWDVFPGGKFERYIRIIKNK